ncbi:hypothetical protein AAS39_003750 [Escherichia coli]|nr:hypothetical protein [Escherichia coli]VEE35993.1 Protein of uncharacterised function (DUF3279) [Escherichia coli]
MRILNCYMANDSKGHFVTAKEAAKHNRQDVLCCVSCGCPLTLQRGNDGQPPVTDRLPRHSIRISSNRGLYCILLYRFRCAFPGASAPA